MFLSLFHQPSPALKWQAGPYGKGASLNANGDERCKTV